MSTFIETIEHQSNSEQIVNVTDLNEISHLYLWKGHDIDKVAFVLKSHGTKAYWRREVCTPWTHVDMKTLSCYYFHGCPASTVVTDAYEILTERQQNFQWDVDNKRVHNKYEANRNPVTCYGRVFTRVWRKLFERSRQI
jgi:hypothetical protein